MTAVSSMARLTTIGTSNGSFAGLAAKLLTAEATQWVWYEDCNRDTDSVYVVLVIEYKVICNRYYASFSLEICHFLSFDLDLTFDLDHRHREEFVLVLVIF